jgi:Fe2+ or Zn2+ uptake regulation protein
MEKRVQTRQKTAIRDALLEADRPLSPDEILAGAQRHHPRFARSAAISDSHLQRRQDIQHLKE